MLEYTGNTSRIVIETTEVFNCHLDALVEKYGVPEEYVKQIGESVVKLQHAVAETIRDTDKWNRIAAAGKIENE